MFLHSSDIEGLLIYPFLLLLFIVIGIIAAIVTFIKKHKEDIIVFFQVVGIFAMGVFTLFMLGKGCNSTSDYPPAYYNSLEPLSSTTTTTPTYSEAVQVSPPIATTTDTSWQYMEPTQQYYENSQPAESSSTYTTTTNYPKYSEAVVTDYAEIERLTKLIQVMDKLDVLYRDRLVAILIDTTKSEMVKDYEFKKLTHERNKSFHERSQLVNELNVIKNNH